MPSLAGYPVIICHQNGDFACVPLNCVAEGLYQQVTGCDLYPPLSKVQRVYFIRFQIKIGEEYRPMYYPMSHGELCYPTSDILPLFEWLEQGRLNCGCVGVGQCSTHPPRIGTDV